MAHTVSKLQGRLRYRFKNAQFLWEAVQAPGSIVRSGELACAGTERHSVGFRRFPDGNRRLAVLGDTVLKLALVEDWYKDGRTVRGMPDGVDLFLLSFFPPLSFFLKRKSGLKVLVERLSRIVSDVGSNAKLGMVGRTHGLDAFINKSPSDKYSSVGTMTMASTVEAIIGAVYLDNGMKSVDKVMRNMGLMPRLVRRTVVRASASENVDSSEQSTAVVEDQREPEMMAPRDSEEGVWNVMKSSQELGNALGQYSKDKDTSSELSN